MSGESGPPRAGLFAILVLIAIGGTGDLLMDFPRRWLSLHTAFELLMTGAAVVGVVAFWLAWWSTRRSVAELERSLREQQAERDAWRASARNALQGLGQAIDRQFDGWRLTPAERAVALLLLKGRSHKHIARTTDRSERTVRQHAAMVYEKAGLGGRAELAAFFLEDVMLPAADRAGAGTPT